VFLISLNWLLNEENGLKVQTLDIQRDNNARHFATNGAGQLIVDDSVDEVTDDVEFAFDRDQFRKHKNVDVAPVNYELFVVILKIFIFLNEIGCFQYIFYVALTFLSRLACARARLAESCIVFRDKQRSVSRVSVDVGTGNDRCGA
jgi:hypothetical protein